MNALEIKEAAVEWEQVRGELISTTVKFTGM